MAGVDDFFSQLNDPTTLDQEAQRRQRQASFEEGIVKRLMAYANVKAHIAASRRSAWEEHQQLGLTFEWFHRHYPAYPVRLGSAKLMKTSGTHIGWTDLFGPGFMKLPWVAEYQRLANELNLQPQRDRIGLLFNAPHAAGAALMVLHNQPIQAHNVVDFERRDETETRIIRPFGKPRVVYVIESFNSFMATAGTDWAQQT